MSNATTMKAAEFKARCLELMDRVAVSGDTIVIINQALRDGQLGVSAFSFWGVALLIAAGRLRVRGTPDEFRVASLRAGIAEIPVDGKIAILSTQLTGMHADPADRIIVATALETGAMLVTADAQILGMRTGPERLDAQT